MQLFRILIFVGFFLIPAACNDSVVSESGPQSTSQLESVGSDVDETQTEPTPISTIVTPSPTVTPSKTNTPTPTRLATATASPTSTPVPPTPTDEPELVFYFEIDKKVYKSLDDDMKADFDGILNEGKEVRKAKLRIKTIEAGEINCLLLERPENSPEGAYTIALEEEDGVFYTAKVPA